MALITCWAIDCFIFQFFSSRRSSLLASLTSRIPHLVFQRDGKTLPVTPLTTPPSPLLQLVCATLPLHLKPSSQGIHAAVRGRTLTGDRSEEHTSELQSL